MAKKDLQSVTANLQSLAATMPTQMAVEAAPPVPLQAKAAKPRLVKPVEENVQISLTMRKSLRKDLEALARDADMTMRAFVLNALRSKGLEVHDADLVDFRKTRTGS